MLLKSSPRPFFRILRLFISCSIASIEAIMAFAHPISRNELRDVSRYLHSSLPAMTRLLRRMVELESPSNQKAAVDRLSSLVAREWKRRGAGVRLLHRKACGDIVSVRWPSFHRPLPGGQKQLLVLGHLDTVYPLGSLARMPFRIAGARACGPGTYDMKAGVVMALFAVDALCHVGIPVRRNLAFLWTTDEEIGSTASRSEIERQARRSAAVLVLEPSLGARGFLKTSRKGVGEIELRVYGKSAHAGMNPRDGINAVHELSLQLSRMADWADPARGLVVSPTVASGGSFSNVIPDFASARVDIRFSRPADANVLAARLRRLKPILRGAQLEIHGGINRPPLVRTASVLSLFRQAREIGRLLGLDLREGATGGGSDGNFTAALGVPTLDGLGAIGEGAHTPRESINLRALPKRTALLAALLAAL